MRTQDMLALQAILTSIQGSSPTVIIINHESRTIFSGDPNQFEPSTLAMRCSMLEAEPVEFKFRDYEPLFKPTKHKLLIKEPKRQSFRQSMRSVNRNR